LRCFRFRQKKIPAATRRATATIGTTTATAIVPPLLSPFALFAPGGINEAPPLDADDDGDDAVVPGTTNVLAVFVTVWSTVVVWPLEVIICVLIDSTTFVFEEAKGVVAELPGALGVGVVLCIGDVKELEGVGVC